ncbi:Cl-channel protein [Mycena floridula]|nr:Cl-channel protein [Mycena floridula]
MSGYRSRPPPLPFDREEEAYELREDGQLAGPSIYEAYTAKYDDGRSIDWLREESAERERIHAQRNQKGVRGILLTWMDSARMWLVIAATGVGIGLAGAWLDVLVQWLGDLREGRCTYGFFYNQVACCSGLDPGEICREWKSWSEFFHLRHILAVSLLQTFVYVVLAITFAGSAAVLVKSYAPYAFHTGIPEIKAILGGYVFDAFLSPWTLLIKALGLALAVASGLSLGKEGPLVHVACCMANLLSRSVKLFRHNEAQKRKLLAAAAAAGVSVAFGSPLGGVLFGLEELDTFANESDVMWRGFVASAIAAVALQYVDPFGTSKMVLFQVTGWSDTWRSFELIPWVGLGIIGGVVGSLLIKLNVEIAVYRRNSVLNEWPVLEVVAASAITAAISYLVVFARVQTSQLVTNLFQECDPVKGDFHGLCNPTALWENVFLLLLTAAMKFALTSWTFGMMIPAGIFLPTIAMGACLGRAVGLMTQELQRAYPKAWIFLSCPPDPSVKCVSPGFYAVIGASGMLGGVTRMTISLVVILFELTGALSHVLPIMICVMTSKFVGDALGKDGIYSAWIAMRGYPWLHPDEYHDQGENACRIMKPAEQLVVIEDEQFTVMDLVKLLQTHQVHGFPVVYNEALLGYVTRDKLTRAIEPIRADIEAGADNSEKCTFRPTSGPDEEYIDLSDTIEESVLRLRKEVPLEFVVRMFQRLNLRQILFTHGGKLVGMVTKSDVVSLLTMHFPHTAALQEGPVPT